MLNDVDLSLKQINIIGTNTRYQIKRVTQDKIVKSRNKIKDWNINISEIVNSEEIIGELLTGITTKIGNIFKNEITHKLRGYKSQDTIKKMIDPVHFISFVDTIQKLNDCKLKCFYCSEPIFILYSIVREKKQWTLDRINNDIGHNTENVIIACLECNLQRRRKTKDSFAFSKQFILTREEYTNTTK